MTTELTAERLRELLEYDQDTGVFMWKVRRNNRAKVGGVAGAPNRYGYWRIRIDGRKYMAHRLAWLWVHGRWPAEQLDHINGIKDDNRLANLRECSDAENKQNIVSRAGSISKHLGVSWNKALSKWRAKIRHDGKQQHLGVFTNEEDAAAAYREAKARLHTFHPVPRSQPAFHPEIG